MLPAALFRVMLVAGVGAASYLFARQGGFQALRSQLGDDRQDSPDDSSLPMLHDPHCDTYFPAEEAVEARVSGRRMSFCSPECAAAYRSRR